MFWASLPMKINKNNFHLHLWSALYQFLLIIFWRYFIKMSLSPNRILVCVVDFFVSCPNVLDLCPVFKSISLLSWFEHMDRIGKLYIQFFFLLCVECTVIFYPLLFITQLARLSTEIYFPAGFFLHFSHLWAIATLWFCFSSKLRNRELNISGR